MTKLYLIRHAEAEGNLYRRIHGQYNSLITDNGYRQIKALEERFRDIPVDAVYSSDLFRTMTTAQAICRPKNLPLLTRPDLREINMGDWEDRSFAGIDRTDRDMMRLFGRTSPLFRAPNGESFPEIRHRGISAIRDIAARHPDQTVAVFAHGTLIRNTLAEIMGLEIEDAGKVGHSDNTAVTLLEIDGDTIRIVSANDNSHLSPEISTLARQHWWNKDSKKRDVNLWFASADMTTTEDRTYFASCREDAWRNLYGSLDGHETQDFLDEAIMAWHYDPKNLAIAMDGDKRVGLLQLDLARDAREDRGYVSFLYLAEEQRNQGIGIQLVGKAVSVCRPLGRQYLRLVCSQENVHALAFYEKYGFRTTNTIPGVFGTLNQMEKYIGYDSQGELD